MNNRNNPNNQYVSNEHINSRLTDQQYGELTNIPKDNTFPTVQMKTTVGDVSVNEKSYDVQGNIVDSSQDTPIDVNAMYNTELPAEGLINLKVESE